MGVGSTPVHNAEVCLLLQCVQNGAAASDKGFELLPDKTERGLSRTQRGLSTSGSRPHGLNTANVKVRH